MKKFWYVFCTLCILMLAAGSVSVSAAEGEVVQVELDGQIIAFPDQQPIIYHERTMIPVRGVFEAAGATVTWAPETQTVSVQKDDISLTLVVGEDVMLRNGAEIPLEVPVTMLNDRVMIPVRAVMEALTLEVGWEPVTRTVIIISPAKDAAWDYIYSTKKISVGVIQDYPPMAFSASETEELTGFDVEFSELLAEKLGLACEVVPIRWSEKFEMLNSGMVDIIVSAFSVEDDRIEEVMFSIPYLKSSEVLMTKQSLGIQTVEDLAFAKIGMLDGFATVGNLKEIAGGEIIRFDTYSAARSSLDAGEIQAMIVDKVYAQYYQKLDSDYQILYDLQQPVYFAIGMNIEALSLRAKLNDAIEELQQDADFDTLLTKWFGDTENKVE